MWEYLLVGVRWDETQEGWRYRLVPEGAARLSTTTLDESDALNELGRQGWELVTVGEVSVVHPRLHATVLQPRYYFKRRVEP
jgi:hypothetical protein